MPWRGPEYEGEFPSLGYEVAQWIQDHCVIPDREHAGQPFILTDEQLRFLLFHYAVDPATGRWSYERGSQLIRPRKWGKAPLTAAMVCAEAAGPVKFDGWDASGEPVGKPWPTPLIQCVACSQDQVANVWRVLVPMITLGHLDADIPDTGESRINLPNGRIEPVTASARSRVGQRTTFAVKDETQMWLESNGGHKLDGAIGDNLAGTGGRSVETCNAFDPAEQSVAQLTFEADDPHVFRDDAPAPPGDVNDFEQRDRVLRVVYGDSLRSERNPDGWIDPQRIHIEIDARIAKGQGDMAERMFLNRKLAQAGAAFDIEKFKAGLKTKFAAKRSVVVAGVDGARFRDALGIVVTDVKTGRQWVACKLERPENAPDDYEHDFELADAAMRQVWEDYTVWRVYIDDQRIEGLVEKWANRWGPGRIKVTHTTRKRWIADCVREYAQAIAGGDTTYVDDSDGSFATHIANARKQVYTDIRDDHGVLMHSICKVSVASRAFIDLAMAGVLSWKARGDAIEAGVVVMDKHQPREPEPVERWEPGHAPNMNRWGPAQTVGPMGSLS